MRGTVLAEGIGEELTRLPQMPNCYVLIAKPPISVSTKMVYEKLDSGEITDHPDIDGILQGLRSRAVENGSFDGQCAGESDDRGISGDRRD